jgi:phosphoglycerol transferase MdoB-like AlkP superfamily enzyme
MTDKQTRLSLFSLQLFRLVVVQLSILLLSFIYRWVFLFRYGHYSEWKEYIPDFFHGFSQGMRLDTQAGLYFLVPLIAFALLSGVFKHRLFSIIAQVWSCIALIIYAALLIGDFYYYGFFGSHFSVSTFGLINDDTQAVLKSMWTDYPTVRILLFFTAVCVGIVYWVRWIYRFGWMEKLSRKKRSPYIAFLIIPLVVLLMRGSIGTFPLRNYDAYVTKSMFVNNVFVNPVISLKDAYKLSSSGKQVWDVNEMLAQAGYASAEQLVADYLNISVDSILGDPLSYLTRSTFSDPFLKDNPPHVVFLQMEGMGLNGLNLQSRSFDIFGKLKDELPYCTVFLSFLPYTMESTINTLEGLVVYNTMTPLAQSKVGNRPVLSSVTYPFKHAGYKTIFVTGSKQGWRNINVFLPAQGFDVMEGQEALLHDIPDTQLEEWGAYDEYMFKQIYNHLASAESPQFIYGMSITNHSPHHLPNGYPLPDLTISEDMKARLIQDEKYSYSGFSTFRYANDCLADFIHAVRESPFGEKVIIAATGDHTFKGFLKSKDEDIYDKYGVPLILYIPDQYKKNKNPDLNRCGSHRDIFPTLFNLSLSETSYYNFGIDLLNDDPDDNSMGIIPGVVLVSKTGAVNLQNIRNYRVENHTTFIPDDTDEARIRAEQLNTKYHQWMTILRYAILRSYDKR